MKSNDVRMKLNRDLHAQFKLVDGSTNDERMAKLLSDSEEKYALISYNHEIIEKLGVHERSANHWLKQWRYGVNQKKTLARALAASIAVSVCSVAYVCSVNGWFHG